MIVQEEPGADHPRGPQVPFVRGGAEIFDDRVHDEVFKGKVRADRWFDVHRTAHSLGIYSNATMLYGHVETPAERIGPEVLNVYLDLKRRDLL